MAAPVADPAAQTATKRKRQENGDSSKKRRKSAGADDVEPEGPKARIQKLEAEIQESRKHYNNIAALIELAQRHRADPKTALPASEALCRIFIRLLAAGNLVKRKDVSEKDATVTGWLRDRLADYRGSLLSMLRSRELASNALVLAMAILKAEAQHLSEHGEPVFPRYFFADILASLLKSPAEHIRDEFSEKFVDEYDDIRFYTFEALKSVALLFPSLCAMLTSTQGLSGRPR